MNQLPVNQLPVNQAPMNQLPVNQLPMNQPPMNQDAEDLGDPQDLEDLAYMKNIETDLENEQLEGTFNKPDEPKETPIEIKMRKATSGLYITEAPVNADKETEMIKKTKKNKSGEYPTVGFSDYRGLPDNETTPKLLVHGIYPTYLYSAIPTGDNIQNSTNNNINFNLNNSTADKLTNKINNKINNHMKNILKNSEV
jgi:hypothetical protein